MSVGSNPTTDRLLTAEEFMLRPEPADGSQEELVEGRVVTMPPPQGDHGIVCVEVARLLANFVKPRKLGWVAGNDSDAVLSRNPDSVRGPDVAFYSIERVPARPTGYFEVPPDLAVEVVSPSDRLLDVQQKVWQYLQCGVRLVWVINPVMKNVTVYESLDHAQVLDETKTLDGAPVLPGFTCRVGSLFE
jgi:Uma2 family endonuclease